MPVPGGFFLMIIHFPLGSTLFLTPKINLDSLKVYLVAGFADSELAANQLIPWNSFPAEIQIDNSLPKNECTSTKLILLYTLSLVLCQASDLRSNSVFSYMTLMLELIPGGGDKMWTLLFQKSSAEFGRDEIILLKQLWDERWVWERRETFLTIESSWKRG